MKRKEHPNPLLVYTKYFHCGKFTDEPHGFHFGIGKLYREKYGNYIKSGFHFEVYERINEKLNFSIEIFIPILKRGVVIWRGLYFTDTELTLKWKIEKINLTKKILTP